MKPTRKAAPIEHLLETVAGRTSAIESDHCVASPIGCGKSVLLNEFRDEQSLKEYRISGLCQQCQDKIFGS